MSGTVLVISASMGEGHDGAARELVRRLRERGHEGTMVDFLDAPPLKIGPLTRWTYEFQLRRAPWTYEATYRIWSILPFLCGPLTAYVTLITGRRHLKWIRELQPDVVVTTYPLTSLVLGRLRKKNKIDVPTVTFVTDFAVHPLWVHRGVDLTLCVHPQAAVAAARRTGREARAPGPMVADRFRGAQPDREAARVDLGLGPDDKAVLVVAGSWGVGEIDRTFDTLAASGRYIPVAVCGRSEALRESLARHPGGRVLGWTDEMPALMAACDAVVQNAGGLTCMEAFAVGLPVVTYLPIPGHGKVNGEEMERAGVAAYARRPEELLSVLDRVTAPTASAQVATARAVFRGDAADDVAGLIQQAPVAAVLGHCRPAHRRVRIAAIAAVLVALWSAFTLGVGVAAAHGIGMARSEPNVREIYLGVRISQAAIADPALAHSMAGTGVTAIIDGSLASDDPGGVRRLTDAGIDVANGGSGRHNALHWARARADVVLACRSIESADHQDCHAFVPGRRVDGFDVASARVSHQKIVANPTPLSPEHLPGHLRAGRIYVLDAQALDATTVARALDGIRSELAAERLTIAPFADLR